MNKVSLIGRVTKDIEVRYTPSEKAYVNFTLAVPRRTSEDETDFISCTAWSKTAEIMGKYVSKGDRIGASGRIQVRNYENQEGKKVYVTEVIIEEFDFIEQKKEKVTTDAPRPLRQPEKKTSDGFIEVDDDELPF